ncbi:hypothetical protein D3C81_2217510 [compost metagenome]
MLQQLCFIFTMFRIVRDAYAGHDIQYMLIDAEGRLQGQADFFRHQRRLFR